MYRAQAVDFTHRSFAKNLFCFQRIFSSTLVDFYCLVIFTEGYSGRSAVDQPFLLQEIS